MTLLEKYTSYLRYEKNYSSLTEISYVSDLRQFQQFLEDNFHGYTLEAVDADIARAWIMHLMENQTAARSVNRKLSSLKSFYRYLQRVGILKTNPLSKIVGPKNKKPIPSFVTYNDMEKVLDVGVDDEEDYESFRDKVILELFYVTGMRRAELIGLKDQDIDLDAGNILVNGKRNKQRIVPISNQTIELLKKYLDVRTEVFKMQTGFFFAKEVGKPIYPMLVHRVVTRQLKWIPTLSKASPHVLRHSFATGMLNNGADINAVKELLGHSSLASTEIYTHTSFEELKKIYSKAHPRA